MRRIWQIRGVGFFLICGALATLAWGETIELITYFPSTAQAGDLHLNSLTVGDNISGVTPGDGEVLIDVLLGIGTTIPEHALHVVDDGLDSYVAQFEQDRATGSSRLGIINTAAADTGNTAGITFLGNSTAGETEFFSIRSSLNVTDHATRNTLTEFIQNNAGIPETVIALNGGFVGIGRTDPEQALHAVGDGSTSYVAKFEQTDQDTTPAGRFSMVGVINTEAADSDNKAGIEFRGNSSAQERTFFSIRSSLSVVNDATRNTLTRFMQSDALGGGFRNVMVLDGGNVGIGIDSPTAEVSPGNGQGWANLDVNDIWVRANNGGNGGWASAGGGGGGAPDWDSGWVADNNSTYHMTTFTHPLGVIPSRLQLLFATSDNNPEIVYSASESLAAGSNPATISMSTTVVQLHITVAGPLYSAWLSANSFQTYQSGFWRVKLWK